MSAAVRIRPGSPDDVPALSAVLAANGDSMAWPGLPGWPYLEHLVRRGRVELAEIDRAVVGFAGAAPVGDAVMLADLFVDPAHHGRGIGQALLAAALREDRPRMTFSSADPRALPIYARAGMRPWWPVLYVEAGPGVIARLPLAADIAIEPAPLDLTVAFSHAESGIDRGVDFGHYASLPDAAGFVVRQAGTIVAGGWARRNRSRAGRCLDHATVARSAEPVQAAVGALRAAAPAGEP
ncbi:MAG TPA: GNAT family N-acetyltransferase, partial [Clostridia bacterium]|nr:GNAT family N-acetyltransferase [Clostridia bacterium]